jgi:predicted acylesterase/phospholipase RssA
MRRWPPTRRVVLLDDSSDPEREIAASAAVPFGAQAIEIDGGSHVDGAVWSVTNADVARPDGLDLLIVIAPLVTTDGGTLVSGLGRHQLAVELGPWRRASKPVLVFAPTSQEYRRRSDRPAHRRDGYACADSIIPSK